MAATRSRTLPRKGRTNTPSRTQRPASTVHRRTRTACGYLRPPTACVGCWGSWCTPTDPSGPCTSRQRSPCSWCCLPPPRTGLQGTARTGPARPTPGRCQVDTARSPCGPTLAAGLPDKCHRSWWAQSPSSARLPLGTGGRHSCPWTDSARRGIDSTQPVLAIRQPDQVRTAHMWWTILRLASLMLCPQHTACSRSALLHPQC
mmetsp:Transcript_3185/g.9869  ORF Transcript_3185/g.9869 Transcript_3185/m.9869 type:complete len:203 (-) Transcript_3185:2780-3388(-)